MTSPAPLDRLQVQLPDLFTTEEAYAAGLTKRDLAGDGYRRLFRGGYAIAGTTPAFADLLAFAMRVVPQAQFASQYSAAQLFGGITPLASNLHLGTLLRRTCTLDGVRTHFYKNTPDLTMFRGIWTTTPPQTFLDLARSFEFVDLLVLGDSLARRNGPSSPAQLRSFVANVSAHGAQHAREVAELVRANVRSPNETRLRLLMHSGGLPTAEINYVVGNKSTGRWREIDLAFPQWKIAVEFDGLQHLERRQWDKDILRREELEALGWKFVHITSTAIYTDPLRVLIRITDKIVLAGGPTIPIRDDWQRHFG